MLMGTEKNKSKNIKKDTNSNEKYIEPKNYVYALLILVGGILLALYIFEWVNVKKEEKIMNSYLITSKTVEATDLESISQSIVEAPASYFIFLSYTDSLSNYNLEKTLKRVIDKYQINDIFYYVDVTDLKNENKDYIKVIKKSLDLPDLENVPAIIYVDEGHILEKNILDGDNDNLVTATELENLLEKYEYEPLN